ncbi:radical SAM family heme chaperone HemW [Jannaschia rubra]|uniref:Heme chaperone HemW n=1 Tax=Jannaschia rubra TaxID=282197 RepID=A0A0M6XRC7_9RHOB|nr:radical SAM family heme chaperone HemW [Jannaschia rubra]CTQ32773.1 Oxygen-independent coproporphyrinogen-III oxidase 1 [Jannaschia rubra]SFF89241.1 oxygen-independent coproporphyrinogen-3 oxidase [Jannaschia rubra]
MENWQQAGFGLYVHWPFCAAKCPYCDFNSHVVSSVDQARWRAALIHDIDYWAARTPGRMLTSIFFGGGTPSLMPPETVAAVIDAARRHWTPANDIEITLEANPTSVEAGRFADYVGGGVNRFSVGLQALNDADLRTLGRLHTAAEGRRAFDVATSVCERVSFDLIYARQHQTLAGWTAELTEALSFAGEHLSLYQLTVEENTAFGARARAGGLRGLPKEDLAVDLYQVTQDLCGAAGLPRYETSNHARPGAESRHNRIYWAAGDWIGVGPGAHGRVGQREGRVATAARPGPMDWLTDVEGSGRGRTNEDILQKSDIYEEYIIMSLRTTAGIDLDRLAGMGGLLDKSAVEELTSSGMLISDGHHLRTSEAGALLVNAILGKIVAVDP